MKKINQALIAIKGGREEGRQWEVKRLALIDAKTYYSFQLKQCWIGK